MELSKQVCSLEQAKKLKELGIEQKTSFYYVIRVECTQPETRVTRDMAIDAGDMSYEGIIYQEAQFEQTLSLEYGDITKSDCEYYAAFTVAELGVMLPYDINEEWQQRPFMEYYPHTDKYHWKFHNHFTEYGSDKIVTDCGTEAEARAYMLLWLIEKGHITVEEVNARLTC